MSHRSSLLIAGAAATPLILSCSAQVDSQYEGEKLLTLTGQVRSDLNARESLKAADAELGLLWFSSDDDRCGGSALSEGAVVATSSAQAPTISEDGEYIGGSDWECISNCNEARSESSAQTGDERSALQTWKACMESCGEEVTADFSIDIDLCTAGVVGERAPTVGSFPSNFTLDVMEPPGKASLLEARDGTQAALGMFVAMRADSGEVRLSPGVDARDEWLLGTSTRHLLLYTPEGFAADSLWGRFLGDIGYEPGFHLLQIEPGVNCGSWTDSGKFIPPTGTGVAYFEQTEDEGSGPPEPISCTGPASISEGDAPDGVVADGGVADDINAGAEETSPADSEDEGCSFEFEEVDLTRYELICGNGVCEGLEDAENCEDCWPEGKSSGVVCAFMRNIPLPAPDGLDTPIEVVIPEASQILFPHFTSY